MTIPLELESAQAVGPYNETLFATLNELTDQLERRVRIREEGGAGLKPISNLPTVPALDALATIFRLSDFEKHLLLWSAGVALHPPLRSLCIEMGAAGGAPTFGIGLAMLDGAHWDAVAPSSALRFWRLLDLPGTDPLIDRPIQLEERVLHYLLGIRYLDEDLVGFMRPLGDATDYLSDSQLELAATIAQVWRRSEEDTLSVVQLIGTDAMLGRRIAQESAAQISLGLYALDARQIPTGAHELDALVRLWERDAFLGQYALLLEWEEEKDDSVRAAAIQRFVESVSTVLIIATPVRRRVHGRRLIPFELRAPSAQEQSQLWHSVLSADKSSPDGNITRIVSHFDLNRSSIESAGRRAQVEWSRSEERAFADLLWDACRIEARPALDQLTQRIEAIATWDDIVLPERQRSVLEKIALHVRQRARVYEEWGFAGRSSRGLGISALFAGVSGTGKTMAAEVLANELELDLYRIDLSQTVSKYIGETEKNLSRIFDAADAGGAILLFDEADALFGKRSEVRDSHDRYANIEISYLLQRMESYRGLAILTSNMKDSLDDAFLRRIRFIVPFPFPAQEERAAIWRRVFPESTPTDGISEARLSQLNIAGGNIRNIALNAAFLAADGGESVTMSHLHQAARDEYLKLEKPLTASETRGWL